MLLNSTVKLSHDLTFVVASCLCDVEVGRPGTIIEGCSRPKGLTKSSTAARDLSAQLNVRYTLHLPPSQK